jgi:DNA-binding NarL/FixJ family response regulator
MSTSVSVMVTTAQEWSSRKSAKLQTRKEDAVRSAPADVGLVERRATLTRAKLAGLLDPPAQERAARDGLRLAATAADEQHAHPSDPSALWQDLINARAHLYTDWHGATRSYLVALMHGGGGSEIRRPLGASEATILERVLCGTQQKAVACDLNIAHSTASKRHALALGVLDINGRPAPLPLVVLAQHAAGAIHATWARLCVFEYQGCSFTVISVRRPRIPSESRLTASERDVAARFIEGGSRWDIARARSRSEQTVSCQLRGIFAKLQLSGRNAAILRAAQLGWLR